MIILCIIAYWFITFAIQVGVGLVYYYDRDIKYTIVESIFIGWLLVPLEIGGVIGYMLNKINNDN